MRNCSKNQSGVNNIIQKQTKSDFHRRNSMMKEITGRARTISRNVTTLTFVKVYGTVDLVVKDINYLLEAKAKRDELLVSHIDKMFAEVINGDIEPDKAIIKFKKFITEMG